LEASDEPARAPLSDEILQPQRSAGATAAVTDRGRRAVPPPAQPNHRNVLIWGVGISFILVLTLWLGVMRFRPQRNGPNSADQTIANIGRVLSDFSSQFSQQIDDVQQQLNAAGDTTGPEVRTLQQQVFPEFIK
jgi:hypothetical protein